MFSEGKMLSIFLAMLLVVNGQDCLLANSINGLPPLQDYETTGFNSGIIPHTHQAIIPSYRFQCCGNITQWGADVNVVDGRDDTMYTLDFQVWRPDPDVSISGCYSLVGNNRFISVPLTNGVALSLTPQPNEEISFQPGDVLGFYVESTASSSPDSRGVAVLRDRNVQGDGEYQNEVVWYRDFSNPVIGNSACPADVGPRRLLNSSTNAAPVISPSFSITQCPPTQIESLTSSTRTTNSHRITFTLPNLSTLPTNTDENMDNINLPASSLSLVIVIAPPVCAAIIVSLTLLVGLVICAKVRQNHKSEVSITHNEAYGTRLQSLDRSAEDTYDYPIVDQASEQKPFDMKGNEAYICHQHRGQDKQSVYHQHGN